MYIHFTAHANRRLKEQKIDKLELVNAISLFPKATLTFSWTLPSGDEVIYKDEGNKRSVITIIGKEKRWHAFKKQKKLGRWYHD